MNSYTHPAPGLLTPSPAPFDTFISGSRHTVYDPSRIGNGLQAMGKALMTWLSTGSEPHITKFTQGNTEVWKLYDPVGDRTFYFYQEDEVRTWLDQRFYQ